MDAKGLISKIKGTSKAADKKTVLDSQQFVCQEGTGCDCHGCNDSG